MRGARTSAASAPHPDGATLEGMTAVVSIELLLDAEAEAAVRAEWAALSAAGMSSLAAHPGASNRPHITMLVRSGLPRFDAASVVAHRSFAVVLGAPVLFGTGERRVLARSVVPTAALRDVHAAVHRAAGPGDDAAHTTPDAWTPHVTLARRIRLAGLPAALALVDGEITATATGLRRWDAATQTVTDLGGFG